MKQPDYIRKTVYCTIFLNSVSKVFLFFFNVFTILIFLTSCSNFNNNIWDIVTQEQSSLPDNTNDIPVSNITLNETEFYLSLGYFQQLDSTVEEIVSPGTETFTFYGLSSSNQYSISIYHQSVTGIESAPKTAIITPTVAARSFILIYTTDDMNEVRSDTSADYILMQDLNLLIFGYGEGWEPISVFDGSFDGNGYILSNLTINRPADNNQGLFSSILNSATIKNLTLANVSITGYDITGGATGESLGTLLNCKVTGTISGTYRATSGITGWANTDAVIKNCTFNGSLYGNAQTGGIAGRFTNASITDCYVSGNITGTGDIGGLIG